MAGYFYPVVSDFTYGHSVALCALDMYLDFSLDVATLIRVMLLNTNYHTSAICSRLCMCVTPFCSEGIGRN